MRGWLQNRFANFRQAWADAGALMAHHGDMGQREAVLRAQDPRGEDGPRVVVSLLASGRSDHRLEDRRGFDLQHSASVAIPPNENVRRHIRGGHLGSSKYAGCLSKRRAYGGGYRY